MAEGLGGLKINMDVDLSAFDAGVDGIQNRLNTIQGNVDTTKSSISDLAQRINQVLSNVQKAKNNINALQNASASYTSTSGSSSKGKVYISQDEESKYLDAVQNAINKQAMLMSK